MGIIAAGVALHYLKETQHNKVESYRSTYAYRRRPFCWMDQFTIRNLELVQSTGVNGVSLLNVLDQTVSPMGARMLRRFAGLPLKAQKAIQDRLNIVDYFTHHGDAADELVLEIKKMGDLERLISKVATARICPREVVQLKQH